MDQSAFIRMLIARWQSTTPVFFKKVQKISLYLCGFFGAAAFLYGQVLTTPSYSSVVSTAAGFLVTFFGAVATTSQLASADQTITAQEKNIPVVGNPADN